MKSNSHIQMLWSRCGLIVELTRRLQGVSPQFGKTVLQKMVFLLQEVYKADVGYSFRFYTYGPFACQLLGDLDIAEHVNAVRVKNVGDGSYGGYAIELGESADRIAGKAGDCWKDIQGQLDALVDVYGGKTAKELEMLTSVVYLNRELWVYDEWMSKTEAISKIRELKPKFTETEIRDGMSELAERHNSLEWRFTEN